MAGETTSLKKGDLFALAKDNTFTIPHDGGTLQFKLDIDKHSVELVAINKPAAGTSSAEELLRVLTGPRVAFEHSLLKELAKLDSTVVFSNVIDSTKNLKASLPSLHQLSQDLAKTSGTKPVLVFRLGGKRGAAGLDIDKAARQILGPRQKLDAHIVCVPNIGREKP
jgi:hypothetical protein